uniref:Elongation factor 1-gamma n=1 Tax=Strigamia maritima TaxID=126957 RepID=T1JND6_STRMM
MSWTCRGREALSARGFLFSRHNCTCATANRNCVLRRCLQYHFLFRFGVMASGTLYTYPGNFRAYKILIAAEFSGVKVKTVSEAPAFVLGQTNKTEEFLKKFPLGKVPAFETTDGRNVFESNAIAYYVGNEQLRGTSPIDQALIQQWINVADNEILPSSCTWVFPCFGIMQYNKQATDRAKDDIKRVLALLNNHLSTRTYLVGERITQADITMCCALLQLYEYVLEPAFRDQFVNTNRWFATLINQPEFKKVLGERKLCEKMAQFDEKKNEKGDKKKEEKKEKVKDDKKKKEEEDLNDVDELELAPKSKDPFEKFPKGNFDMDDFKRFYSNESEKDSIPYFWQKFDKENYSIWFCEYKYPEDLTKTYMSCNLISGMFQRLDKMRKNAFASVILFGEDNNSTISGVWVWKGHELAFPLSADWQVDYESYSWKKLDANSDETKKLVDSYFAWAGDFGGKKFVEGKIFK